MPSAAVARPLFSAKNFLHGFKQCGRNNRQHKEPLRGWFKPKCRKAQRHYFLLIYGVDDASRHRRGAQRQKSQYARVMFSLRRATNPRLVHCSCTEAKRNNPLWVFPRGIGATGCGSVMPLRFSTLYLSACVHAQADRKTKPQ